MILCHIDGIEVLFCLFLYLQIAINMYYYSIIVLISVNCMG